MHTDISSSLHLSSGESGEGKRGGGVREKGGEEKEGERGREEERVKLSMESYSREIKTLHKLSDLQKREHSVDQKEWV